MPKASIHFRILVLSLLLHVISDSYIRSAHTDDGFIRSEIHKLTSENASTRKSAVIALAKTGDMRVEPILQSYKLSELFLWNDAVVLCKEIIEDEDFNEFCRVADVLTGEPILDVNGEPYVIPFEDLGEISPSRSERKLANRAKFLLRLSSPNREVRMSGAKKCGDPPGIIESVSQLHELSENDPIKKIRYIAKESLLLIRLKQTSLEQDSHAHLEIARELGSMKSMRGRPQLQALYDEMMKDATEANPVDEDAKKTFKFAIDQIDGYQGFVGGRR